mgnify:CR=1 FL=1
MQLVVGMTYVSLEAEDNGSGRLLEYYARHGFVLTGRKEGKDPTMQALWAQVQERVDKEIIICENALIKKHIELISQFIYLSPIYFLFSNFINK